MKRFNYVSLSLFIRQFSTKSNELKNIIPNKTPYIFDERTKSKVDDIIFFCNENNKKKLDKYNKKLSINVNKNNYILLHGPSGCGKTHLVSNIASRTGKDICALNLSDLKSQWLGEENQKLNENLKSIDQYYNDNIIIMDEIDTVITKRNYGSMGEKDSAASVNILLSWMDGASTCNNNKTVVFTTNKRDALSKAFLDRISYEIKFYGLSQSQIKLYWKEHLKHLSDSEIEELSKLNIDSFRKANKILNLVVVKKVRMNDKKKISVKDVIDVYNSSIGGDDLMKYVL